MVSVLIFVQNFSLWLGCNITWYQNNNFRSMLIIIHNGKNVNGRSSFLFVPVWKVGCSCVSFSQCKISSHKRQMWRLDIFISLSENHVDVITLEFVPALWTRNNGGWALPVPRLNFDNMLFFHVTYFVDSQLHLIILGSQYAQGLQNVSGTCHLFISLNSRLPWLYFIFGLAQLIKLRGCVEPQIIRLLNTFGRWRKNRFLIIFFYFQSVVYCNFIHSYIISKLKFRFNNASELNDLYHVSRIQNRHFMRTVKHFESQYDTLQ